MEKLVLSFYDTNFHQSNNNNCCCRYHWPFTNQMSNRLFGFRELAQQTG